MAMPPRQPEPTSGEVKADFGTRIAGFAIDFVILSIATWIVGFILGAALGAGGLYVGASANLGAAFLIWVIDLAIVGGYAVYFISSESGQTIGMRVMKIRCVDAETKGVVEINDAIIRFIVSLISFWVCLLGYLWMLWDDEQLTWQDKIASTWVIKVDEETQPQKWP